jgi:DNA-binding response OmpR family regulator
MDSNNINKVLVLGNLREHQELLSILKSQDKEWTTLENWPPVGEEGTSDRFDMVFVDSEIDGLETVCRILAGLSGCPVIVLLDGRTPDWQKLLPLPVDGFLKEDTSRIELYARVRAILNRKAKILQNL